MSAPKELPVSYGYDIYDLGRPSSNTVTIPGIS